MEIALILLTFEAAKCVLAAILMIENDTAKG